MNTELKYKTFDELLSEVEIDFRMYNTEGMIEPSQLIKVAQRVNYDLGLRISKTKETIIEIENGKAKLPDDFDVMNYAMLVYKYQVVEPVLTGTQTEDRLIPLEGYCSQCGHQHSACACHGVFINDCGTHYQIVEKLKTQTRVYEQLEPVRFKKARYVSQVCSDSSLNTSRHAEIKNGYIYINIDNGRMYISYQGAMEDDEGNLLVLDHPMINEYYEYALKQRVLENLYMNGEEVAQKIQLIEQRLRAARNNSLSIVNTPDFAEMKKLWETNRKAQYHKYYNMFGSVPRF